MRTREIFNFCNNLIGLSLRNYKDYKIARQIMKNLVASKHRKLTKDQKKNNIKYSKQVLGSKAYSRWFDIYTLVAGEFREGWIPRNYYVEKLMPVLKGTYGKISRKKTLNKLIFCSELFPDLGSYINGLFFDVNYRVIEAEKVKSYLFSKSDTIVFKIDESARGKGVFVFNKNDFDLNYVKKLGNGLFQYYIKQHSFFSKFMPTAVGTIRVTTYFENSGEVSIRGAYLRLGRESETHIKSDSAIKIPIVINNGKLNKIGHTAKWSEITKHPDTGIQFEGQTIPKWTEICAIVKELHIKIPYVRLIGWDVILDSEDEIKIIEWNGDNNVIYYSEATQGPCFKDLNWEQFR